MSGCQVFMLLKLAQSIIECANLFAQFSVVFLLRVKNRLKTHLGNGKIQHKTSLYLSDNFKMIIMEILVVY